MKRTGRMLIVLAVAAAAVTAVISLSSPAQGGPPVCPEIYAPVICDNGKVYPNQCWADRRNAKNCVPYGEP